MRTSAVRDAYIGLASRLRFIIAVYFLFAVGQAVFAQNVLHWDWHRSTYAQKPVIDLKVNKRKREAIKKAIAAQLRDYLGDTATHTDEELDQMALKTKVELVDLTGHGKHELIAQGPSDEACSPTGNCLFMVFRESKGGHQLLLHEDAVQTFTVQPTRTNGFNDIILYQHCGAFDGGVTMYQFRDGSYHDTACYSVRWSEAGDDAVRKLKEPRFTPSKY